MKRFLESSFTKSGDGPGRQGVTPPYHASQGKLIPVKHSTTPNQHLGPTSTEPTTKVNNTRAPSNVLSTSNMVAANTAATTQKASRRLLEQLHDK